jgi:hypothetical protein
MALRYRYGPSGKVISVAEPHEVQAAEGDAHTGKWKANHQRRTIATMDKSSRWTRVTDEPEPEEPEPEHPEPGSDGGESGEQVDAERPESKYPKGPWVDWAVDSGRLSRADAEAMTVDDLMKL